MRDPTARLLPVTLAMLALPGVHAGCETVGPGDGLQDHPV